MDWPQHVDEVLEQHHELLRANHDAMRRLEGKVTEAVTAVNDLAKKAILLGDEEHQKAVAYFMARAIRAVRRQEWRERIQRWMRKKVTVIGAVVVGIGTVASLVWTTVQMVDHFTH